MKKIKPGEEFALYDTVYTYSVNEGRVIIKAIRKVNTKATKEIIPPSEQEVKEYAVKNGYNPNFIWERMKGYIDSDMKDSRGNPVVNWKLKLNQVWFKPEHKVAEVKKENKVSNFFMKDED